MDARLLGPIEVIDDAGAPVDLHQHKVMVLFALLASRSPAAVQADELVDALWPDRLPARPTPALQTYVSRLRGALGDPQRVQRRSDTYRLELGPHESDLARFAQLVGDGRGALERDDPLTASVRLREALRLFRGPPFAELTYEECLQPELRRLEQQRVEVLGDRIHADLRLGRHASCVAELDALVVAYPSVERFAAQLEEARSAREPTASTDSDAVSAFDATTAAGGSPRPVDDAASEKHPTRQLPGALAAVRTGPLVGRRQALSELVAHRRGLALVVGEPGIGKTRLVAEAALAQVEDGATVWFGRCDERSLWLFEPFVEMLVDALDRLGPAAERFLVQFPDLGRLLPDLATRAGAPSPAAVDAETAQRRTATAVTDLARAVAADGGLTVVIDDLHWADAGTARLVSLLAREQDCAISVIATVRRPGGPSTQLPVGDRDITAEVRLEGLSAAEVDELAQLVTGDPAPRTVAVLHESTGGNPLFVRALVGERSGGHLDGRSAGPTGAGTPAAMQAVIERRVAVLDDRDGQALAIASVIGGDVPVQLVEQVGGPDAGRGLDEASAAGLLRDAGAPGHCAFVHGLVRDAVYDRLGPAQRRRLHLAVGEALEADLPDAGEGVALAVAAHLGASGDRVARERAVLHAAHAAQQAFSYHRFEEAARRFDLALSLVDGPRRASRIGPLLVGRATGLRRAGSPDAPEAIIEAVEVVEQTDDALLLADAVLLLADGRPDAEVVGCHDNALEALDGELGSDVVDRRARLAVAKGWHLAETDPWAAGVAVLEGRRLAEEHAVVAAMAHAQVFEWEMAPLERPPARRLADATALLEAAEAVSDHQSQLMAHHLRANALLEVADLAAAEEAIAAGDRLAGASQMPSQLALGAQRRAMRAILGGDLDEAERHAGDALALMGADPSYGPIFLGQLCAIRTLQGRPEGLVELVEADEANRERPVALAARAVLRARCDDRGEARRLVGELVDRGLDAVPRDMFWTVTMALAADAAVLVDDAELAGLLRPRLVGRSGHLVVFGYCAVCWGTVERFTAPLAVLLGELDTARQEYERSLATHTRIGALPFAAYDQLGLAAVLERLGHQPERAAALGDAGSRTVSALGLVPPVLP